MLGLGGGVSATGGGGRGVRITDVAKRLTRLPVALRGNVRIVPVVLSTLALLLAVGGALVQQGAGELAPLLGFFTRLLGT